MSVSALAVAKKYLELAKEENIKLSNMKLQKLVFFAHGVSLAAFDKPLIKENVKAWNFGPVIPQLYNKLRRFGAGDVTEIKDTAEEIQDEDFLQAINAVWNVYKNFEPWDLSYITHKEGSPWDTVWNKLGKKFEVIDNNIIKTYHLTNFKRNQGA